MREGCEIGDGNQQIPRSQLSRTIPRSSVGTATSPSECVASCATPCFPYWHLQWAGGFDSRRRCPGISLGSRPPLSSAIIFWLAKESACFSLKCPRPIFYIAFERESRLVHRYVRHTHQHSKWGTGLCSRHCVWGAGGRSLWAHVLPPLAQYRRRVIEWQQICASCWTYLTDTITSVSWTKRRSGLWVLNSVCIPPPAACRFPRWIASLPNIGFSRERFEPGSHIADEPNRLAIHPEICVHLVEVSTSENLHNDRPSTLLKSVPVENERCGGHSPSCSTNGWHRGLFPSWRSRY